MNYYGYVSHLPSLRATLRPSGQRALFHQPSSLIHLPSYIFPLTSAISPHPSSIIHLNVILLSPCHPFGCNSKQKNQLYKFYNRNSIKASLSFTSRFIIRGSKLHSYFIASVFTSLNRRTHKTKFLMGLKKINQLI